MPVDQLTFPVSSFATPSDVRTVLLDDFEAIEVRENSNGVRLWSEYDGGFGGVGLEETTTEKAHNGTRSLKVTVTRGNIFMHFLPNPLNMRDYVQSTSAWQFDTFNRMRFWVLLPQGIKKYGRGRFSSQIGTYLRKSDGAPGNQEDGGGHWYHFFDLGYTGQWHQVIIDTHPSHERGVSGEFEHGNQEYVTGESGYNYFDALTRFYFTNQPTDPDVFYFDGFELYDDQNPENVDQAYTLSGVYVPSSNTINMGWSRNKNENTIAHEVRYAFDDIHTIGWNTATPAPGGIVSPLGWQGYNGMAYETNQIDVTGRNKIYMAIKPQNSSLFRQIVITV